MDINHNIKDNSEAGFMKWRTCPDCGKPALPIRKIMPEGAVGKLIGMRACTNPDCIRFLDVPSLCTWTAGNEERVEIKHEPRLAAAVRVERF